uniref:Defensin-like protein n=1 Tax=Strongyloides papillosus TaxID=174720 RepID=A0A0N5B6J9_STREA
MRLPVILISSFLLIIFTFGYIEEDAYCRNWFRSSVNCTDLCFYENLNSNYAYCIDGVFSDTCVCSNDRVGIIL